MSTSQYYSELDQYLNKTSILPITFGGTVSVPGLTSEEITTTLSDTNGLTSQISTLKQTTMASLVSNETILTGQATTGQLTLPTLTYPDLLTTSAIVSTGTMTIGDQMTIAGTTTANAMTATSVSITGPINSGPIVTSDYSGTTIAAGATTSDVILTDQSTLRALRSSSLTATAFTAGSVVSAGSTVRSVTLSSLDATGLLKGSSVTGAATTLETEGLTVNSLTTGSLSTTDLTVPVSSTINNITSATTTAGAVTAGSLTTSGNATLKTTSAAAVTSGSLITPTLTAPTLNVTNLIASSSNLSLSSMTVSGNLSLSTITSGESTLGGTTTATTLTATGSATLASTKTSSLTSSSLTSDGTSVLASLSATSLTAPLAAAALSTNTLGVTGNVVVSNTSSMKGLSSSSMTVSGQSVLGEVGTTSLTSTTLTTTGATALGTCSVTTLGTNLLKTPLTATTLTTTGLTTNSLSSSSNLSTTSLTGGSANAVTLDTQGLTASTSLGAAAATSEVTSLKATQINSTLSATDIDGPTASLRAVIAGTAIAESVGVDSIEANIVNVATITDCDALTSGVITATNMGLPALTSTTTSLKATSIATSLDTQTISIPTINTKNITVNLDTTGNVVNSVSSLTTNVLTASSSGSVGTATVSSLNNSTGHMITPVILVNGSAVAGTMTIEEALTSDDITADITALTSVSTAGAMTAQSAIINQGLTSSSMAVTDGITADVIDSTHTNVVGLTTTGSINVGSIVSTGVLSCGDVISNTSVSVSDTTSASDIVVVSDKLTAQSVSLEENVTCQTIITTEAAASTTDITTVNNTGQLSSATLGSSGSTLNGLTVNSITINGGFSADSLTISGLLNTASDLTMSDDFEANSITAASANVEIITAASTVGIATEVTSRTMEFETLDAATSNVTTSTIATLSNVGDMNTGAISADNVNLSTSMAASTVNTTDAMAASVVTATISTSSTTTNNLIATGLTVMDGINASSATMSLAANADDVNCSFIEARQLTLSGDAEFTTVEAATVGVSELITTDVLNVTTAITAENLSSQTATLATVTVNILTISSSVDTASAAVTDNISAEVVSSDVSTLGEILSSQFTTSANMSATDVTAQSATITNIVSANNLLIDTAVSAGTIDARLVDADDVISTGGITTIDGTFTGLVEAANVTTGSASASSATITGTMTGGSLTTSVISTGGLNSSGTITSSSLSAPTVTTDTCYSSTITGSNIGGLTTLTTNSLLTTDMTSEDINTNNLNVGNEVTTLALTAHQAKAPSFVINTIADAGSLDGNFTTSDLTLTDDLTCAILNATNVNLSINLDITNVNTNQLTVDDNLEATSLTVPTLESDSLNVTGAIVCVNPIDITTITSTTGVTFTTGGMIKADKFTINNSTPAIAIYGNDLEPVAVIGKNKLIYKDDSLQPIRFKTELPFNIDFANHEFATTGWQMRKATATSTARENPVGYNTDMYSDVSEIRQYYSYLIAELKMTVHPFSRFIVSADNGKTWKPYYAMPVGSTGGAAGYASEPRLFSVFDTFYHSWTRKWFLVSVERNSTPAFIAFRIASLGMDTQRAVLATPISYTDVTHFRVVSVSETTILLTILYRISGVRKTHMIPLTINASGIITPTVTLPYLASSSAYSLQWDIGGIPAVLATAYSGTTFSVNFNYAFGNTTVTIPEVISRTEPYYNYMAKELGGYLITHIDTINTTGREITYIAYFNLAEHLVATPVIDKGYALFDSTDFIVGVSYSTETKTFALLTYAGKLYTAKHPSKWTLTTTLPREVGISYYTISYVESQKAFLVGVSSTTTTNAGLSSKFLILRDTDFKTNLKQGSIFNLGLADNTLLLERNSGEYTNPNSQPGQGPYHPLYDKPSIYLKHDGRELTTAPYGYKSTTYGMAGRHMALGTGANAPSFRVRLPSSSLSNSSVKLGSSDKHGRSCVTIEDFAGKPAVTITAEGSIICKRGGFVDSAYPIGSIFKTALTLAKFEELFLPYNNSVHKIWVLCDGSALPPGSALATINAMTVTPNLSSQPLTHLLKINYEDLRS